MSMSAYAREKLTAMALVACLAAGGAGCNKKDDASKPSGVPPLDPTAAPSAPTAAPGAPAMPAAAAPAPAAEAPAADSPGASITGSIVLSPAAAKAKPK